MSKLWNKVSKICLSIQVYVDVCAMIDCVRGLNVCVLQNYVQIAF